MTDGFELKQAVCMCNLFQLECPSLPLLHIPQLKVEQRCLILLFHTGVTPLTLMESILIYTPICEKRIGLKAFKTCPANRKLYPAAPKCSAQGSCLLSEAANISI